MKQSRFDSEMEEILISIDLAEAYRVAGQNNKAITTFEQAAALMSSMDGTEPNLLESCPMTGLLRWAEWVGHWKPRTLAARDRHRPCRGDGRDRRPDATR